MIVNLLKSITLLFLVIQKPQEIYAQTTRETNDDADTISKSVSVAFWGDHYEMSKNLEGLGGFAGLKTLFDQQEPSTIRLCTGDILYPNLLSNRDGGRHRIDILNNFNLTAVILGNHDLDGGTENAKDRILESRFPWLAANAIDKQGNYYTGSQQTLLINVKGISVGIFGLISENTPELVDLNNNITFTSIISTARKMVEELKRKGAQIILAGTHMDPEEDEYLALNVPEINAIFGGHDHSKIAKRIGNTLLIKPGQEAQYLATVKFLVETQKTASALQVTPSWEFITNQNVNEDPQMLKKIYKYQEGLDEPNIPIARIDQSYDTLEDNLRAGNSAFAAMISASLQEYGKADLGFLPGGGIRNKHVYKKGDLFSYEDALKELPFDDMFTVIEVSGRVLVEALENGVSKMPVKSGRFPQVSDMVYSFDVNRPAGSRIIPGSVYIQGKALDLDEMYSVATSNVMVEGRDGYVMLKKAKVLFPYSKSHLVVDIFANYVKNHPSMKLTDDVCNTPSSLTQISSSSALQVYQPKLSFFTDSKNDEFESIPPQKQRNIR